MTREKAVKPKDSLLDSLNEVLGDVRGTKELKGRSVDVEDINVHDIREKYHLTQIEFSKLFGFSLRTMLTPINQTTS